MGIYRRKEPCGCVWETTTYDPYWKEYPVHRCVSHGGTELAAAAWAAREWTGPENPYADPPPQNTTNEPSPPSRASIST